MFLLLLLDVVDYIVLLTRLPVSSHIYRYLVFVIRCIVEL